MRIINMLRFEMPGPGPAAGPKTRIVWVTDEGVTRTVVFEGHVWTLEEAEEAVRRLPPR